MGVWVLGCVDKVVVVWLGRRVVASVRGWIYEEINITPVCINDLCRIFAVVLLSVRLPCRYRR